MAENEEDPFASIIDDCQYSSSQEEFLSHSKFAREDATFAGDGGRSPSRVDSDRYRMEFDGKDVAFAGGSNEVELDGVRADCEVLGFAKETESGRCRVREGEETPHKGSSIEPPLKKSRVSGSSSGVSNGGNVSPLVQCCEKMVIDSGDEGKQIVVFRGCVKVENVSPLRCFSPEVIEIEDEETSESENGEMSNDVDNNADGNEKGTKNRGDGPSEETERRRNRDLPRSLLGKKKLEFGDNTEVIGIHDEPENGDGNKEGTKNRGENGSRDEIERQRKRDLPRSLLRQIWGLNPNGFDDCRNGGNKKRGESSVEGNGGKRPEAETETDETLKHLLDVLKMLATQMLCDTDDGEADIFETSKKRGMTFPRSRFLLDTNKDE